MHIVNHPSATKQSLIKLSIFKKKKRKKEQHSSSLLIILSHMKGKIDSSNNYPTIENFTLSTLQQKYYNNSY